MIAVYIDTHDSLLLLSKDSSFHALYHIISQCDSQKYTWYSDQKNKTEIMEKMNITISTLAKHIASLVDRKLLIHDAKGRYKLNMDILSM